MHQNFDKAVACIRRYEGGKVDDPRDPGGRTNEGVTQSTYDMWRRDNHLPLLDVWLMPDSDYLAILKMYWDFVRSDELPSGVDFCLFNGAWGSGPQRAISWAQRAVNVAVDGKLGPVTMAAIQAHDPTTLIGLYLNIQLAFMQSLSTWSTFGVGWSRRVADVRKTALSWVSNQPASGGVQPLGGPDAGKPNPSSGASTSTSMAIGQSPVPAAPAAPATLPLDWGDMFDVIIDHEKPIVEAAVDAGEAMVLSKVPFGSFLSGFLGPMVINPYIDQGMTALEAVFKGKTAQVPNDALSNFVIGMLNQYEPKLVAFLGDNIDPLVTSLIAKLNGAK